MIIHKQASGNTIEIRIRDTPNKSPSVLWHTKARPTCRLDVPINVKIFMCRVCFHVIKNVENLWNKLIFSKYQRFLTTISSSGWLYSRCEDFFFDQTFIINLGFKCKHDSGCLIWLQICPILPGQKIPTVAAHQPLQFPKCSKSTQSRSATKLDTLYFTSQVQRVSSRKIGCQDQRPIIW